MKGKIFEKKREIFPSSKLHSLPRWAHASLAASDGHREKLLLFAALCRKLLHPAVVKFTVADCIRLRAVVASWVLFYRVCFCVCFSVLFCFCFGVSDKLMWFGCKLSPSKENIDGKYVCMSLFRCRSVSSFLYFCYLFFCSEIKQWRELVRC